MSIYTRLYELIRVFYRRTFMRYRFAHIIASELLDKFIPYLERYAGFYTLKGDSVRFRMDMLLGVHEAETVKIVRKLVKPGMVVLDVGASVGYYTVLFSRLVGHSGKVIAFEPHPIVFQLLLKNTRTFPMCTALQIAVSDSEGTAALFDVAENSGSASLIPLYEKLPVLAEKLKKEYAPRLRNNLPVTSYTVEKTKIDKVLRDLGIEKVDFVKMDIEGSEINAIRGMSETLDNTPHVYLIVELNPIALEGFGFTPKDLLKEIRSNGFSKVSVIEKNDVLIEINNDEILGSIVTRLNDNQSVVNLLCEKCR